MPRRRCQQCTTTFDARRSDAKYCSARCRQQAFQHAARSNGHHTADLTDRSLVDAVRKQLDALDALNTVDGMAALQTAEHLCRDTISGTERTSLTKTLNDVMQRIAATVADPNDPLELIRARWRARRAGAPISSSEFIANPRIADSNTN